MTKQEMLLQLLDNEEHDYPFEHDYLATFEDCE
jgi:hypothetical protein